MDQITPPSQITAGDSVRWSVDLPDYPAESGWLLTYHLVGPETLSVTATAGADPHEVVIPAATSGTWTPGEYAWAASVSSGSDRHTLARGRLTVLHDPAAISDPAALKSHVDRVLERIEAVIEGRASTAVLTSTFEGRQLQFIPLADLITIRDRYRIMQRRERTGQPGARILTRF